MKFHSIAVLVIGMLSLFSCSKTEYEQETRPYTDLISFSFDYEHEGSKHLDGIMSKDSIIVYWNPNIPLPESISPTIEVATGAVVSPASGTSVPFSEETRYTVTAENGDQRTYVLKIKLHREIPLLTSIVASLSYAYPLEKLIWRPAPAAQETSGWYMNLLGEYFLATGNPQDVKVYMQRLYDGYEFDVPIVEGSLTKTSMQIEMPKFSNQLDSGMHRIWVQVGDIASESKDIFLESPSILSNGTIEAESPQAGAEVHAGQTISINYRYEDDLDGAITRYFTPGHLHGIQVTMRVLERVDTVVNERTGRVSYRNVYKSGTHIVTDFEATDSQISFHLPAEAEEFVGGTFQGITLLYNYINKQGNWTHLNDDTGAQLYARGIYFGALLRGSTIVSATGN